MGFLLPASLLALAFVAAPIVAHLVRRRGLEVRPLPTIRFLEAALSASSRRRRIVDLLLLAARILAVIGLALAAAQPFRTLPAARVGDVAVSATFVIDDSHSMRATRDGVPLVRRAVRRALDDLAALPPGSFATVIASGAPPRTLVRRARTRDLAEAALRSLEGGSSRGGALGDALELARAGFEPGLERHLFVYSDFAAHESVPESSFPRGAHAHLHRERPDETVNRRVVDARATPGESPEDPVAVDLRVRTDESERGRFEAGVFLDGELLAKAEAPLDSNGEGRVTLEIDPERAFGGTLEVRLLGPADVLPEDDSRHMLTRGGDYTRVLIVEGRPRPEVLDSASGFLRAALRSAPRREERYAVRVVDDAGLDDRALDEADVIVYADVRAPNAARFNHALRRVEGGAGLLVILGAASDPFAYAGLLGAQAPGRILAAAAGTRSGGESDVLTADLGALRVERHFPIEPDARAEVLFSLAGTPVAVERPHGGGMITLVGIPLDDTLSNFPFLASYLPAVVALFRRLAPPSLERGVITAGEAVSLEPFFRERDEITVETPRGDRVSVVRDAPRFERTGEAGVYRVLGVDPSETAFVAAPPLEETALAEGPLPEPQSLAGEQAALEAARADLTPWLALFAAILLAIEGWVRTREARQARVETTTRGVPPRSGIDRVSR